MNKLDLLNEFRDKLYNNLLRYSDNYLMNSPHKNFIKEWNETKDKIKLIEEIISDESKLSEGIEYIVRDYHCDIHKSFPCLNDAIKYAEEKKREYIRNYDDTDIWIHINGEEDRIYEATGYPKELAEEFE